MNDTTAKIEEAISEAGIQYSAEAVLRIASAGRVWLKREAKLCHAMRSNVPHMKSVCERDLAVYRIAWHYAK